MASGSEFPLPEASVPASVFFWSGSAPASSVSARSTPPSVSVSPPVRAFHTLRNILVRFFSLRLPVSDPAQRAISVVTRSRISVLTVKTAPAASTAIPQIHRPSLFLRPFSSSTSHIRLPAFLPAIGIFVISVCLLPFCYLSLLSSRFLGGFGPKNW